MKPTFFICTIIGIVICLNSCQTKQSDNQETSKTIEQPNFDGIYEFKIGKTTVNALDTLDYKFRELTVKDDIEGEIKNNGVTVMINWKVLCQGVRIFQLKDFQKNNIQFSRFELAFVNDTLCEINCFTSREFEVILKAKYPSYTFCDTLSKSFHTHDWRNNSIWATSQFMYDNNVYAFRMYDVDRKDAYSFLEQEKVKNEYLTKMNSDL